LPKTAWSTTSFLISRPTPHTLGALSTSHPKPVMICDNVAGGQSMEGSIR
jgi:hypothetical protein